MTALLTHEVPPGAAWSLLARRGREIRFTALGDGANVSLLLFPAGDPVDRMNVPDTLKAQHSARIRPPMVLMSDRGLGLASMTGSSLDWHDALGGYAQDAHVGPTSYADHRNDRRMSARSGLLSEVRKHGRDRADLHPPVNLFSKLAIGSEGRLAWIPDHSRTGDWVALRAELDLLLVLSTVPHPSDRRWAPAAVRIDVRAAAPDDRPGSFRAESARALAASAAVLV